MKWYQYFIYLFTLPWDLLTWPAILFIRLFWGQNLCWERAPENGSWCLTVDLKPDSWPARTWYTYKIKKNGKKQKIPNRPDVHDIYGPYRTWAGTVLSPHSIMYGPGRRVPGKWWGVQHHEHIHSEQGEASMLYAFWFTLPPLIYGLVYSLTGLWVMSLILWVLSFIIMVVVNTLTAVLRGEPAYMGSHHEEHAYKSTEVFNQKRGK